MRHGKDVLVDKPGVTTLEQLAALRGGAGRDRRRYIVHASASASRAARHGAAEELVARRRDRPRHPDHRPRPAPACAAPSRPDWFFERARYGGILCDIASHQIDQFLFFTGATRGRGGRRRRSPTSRTRSIPELEDFGEVLLRARRRAPATSASTGSRRTGLPTWGDGRLTHPRHRGLHRAAQVRRHRRPARAATTCSSSTARARATSTAATSRCPSAASLLADVARPHRDRDDAGALLPRLRAGAARAGRGAVRLALRQPRDERRAAASPSSAAASAGCTSRPGRRCPEQFEVARGVRPRRARGAKLAARSSAIAAAPRRLRRAARAATTSTSIDLCTPPSPALRADRAQALAAGKHVDLREAAGRLARRLRPAGRAPRRAASGRLMPIFQYRFGHGLPEAEAPGRRTALAGPRLSRDGRDRLAARRRLLRRALARQVGRPSSAACCSTHAIHAHDMLRCVAGPVRRASSRAPRRASTRSRSRTAPPSRCEHGRRLARHASRSRSARRGDLPPALLLRRLSPPRAASRPTSPALEPWTLHAGDAPRSAPRSTPRSPDFRREPRALRRPVRRFHAGARAGGALPVTLADARASLELLTALYHSARDRPAGRAADRPRPPALPRLATVEWRPGVPSPRRRESRRKWCSGNDRSSASPERRSSGGDSRNAEAASGRCGRIVRTIRISHGSGTHPNLIRMGGRHRCPRGQCGGESSSEMLPLTVAMTDHLRREKTGNLPSPLPEVRAAAGLFGRHARPVEPRPLRDLLPRRAGAAAGHRHSRPGERERLDLRPSGADHRSRSNAD